MKKSNRALPIILVCAGLILAAVIFWDTTLNHLLKPAALAAWLALRSTILRLDQGIIWWAVVALCAVILLLRLSKPAHQPAAEKSETADYFTRRLAYWRSHFLGRPHDPFNRDRLASKLRVMIVTLYAAGKRVAVTFELTDAFREGKIRLPENIHAFLFSPPPPRGFPHSLYRFWDRVSGREEREYRQRLDECLAYIHHQLEHCHE